MADEKISQLTLKTALIDGDLLPIVDSAVAQTKKTTFEDLRDSTTELTNLGEVQGETIGAAQWGHVATMNQNVKTNSNVLFNDIQIGGFVLPATKLSSTETGPSNSASGFRISNTSNTKNVGGFTHSGLGAGILVNLTNASNTSTAVQIANSGTGRSLAILSDTIEVTDLSLAGGIVQTDASGVFSSSVTLPDGTLATTQTPADNSTKLATTAYADAAAAGADEFSELTDVTGAYTTAFSLYRTNTGVDGLEETTIIATEPAANQFTLTRGTTALTMQNDLTVSAASTIDQDLQQSATVEFGRISAGTFITNGTLTSTTNSGTDRAIIAASTNPGNGQECVRLTHNGVGEVAILTQTKATNAKNVLELVTAGTAPALKITNNSIEVTALNTAGGIVQTDSSGIFSSSVTLPDGTLATTQSASDNSTKLATTAYADAAAGGADEFSELTDVTGAYTTANALYKTNTAVDGLEETAVRLTEPGGNFFTLSKGPIALALQGDLTVSANSFINQNLQTTAVVEFAGLQLTGLNVANGFVQTDGSGNLSSSATLPVNDTDTLFTIGGVVNVASETIGADDNALRLNLGLRRSSDTASLGSEIVGTRTRGTAGSPTAVTTNDKLTSYNVMGFDGSDYARAGGMEFYVDSAVSADIVPTRVVFSTANTSGTVTEALRIDDGQDIIVANLTTANGVVQTDGSGTLSSSVTLPDGTLATTQSSSDNSTKLATTAYVDGAVTGEDYWDRTGTVLHTNTANDQVTINTLNEDLVIGGVTFTNACVVSAPSTIFDLNFALTRHSDLAPLSPILTAARTRGTEGSPTVVTTSDRLLSIESMGWDGTDYQLSSTIECLVDSAVSANIVPGRIVFSTSDTAGTNTEAMRIDDDQEITLANLTTAGGIVQTTAAGLLSSSVTLPDGTLATTQTAADNSTKIATTAYVDGAILTEDIWDRTGTTISPNTAADDLDMGTGDAKAANFESGTDFFTVNTGNTSGSASFIARALLLDATPNFEESSVTFFGLADGSVRNFQDYSGVTDFSSMRSSEYNYASGFFGDLTLVKYVSQVKLVDNMHHQESFLALDSASASVVYSRIESASRGITAGTHEGQLSFDVATGASGVIRYMDMDGGTGRIDVFVPFSNPSEVQVDQDFSVLTGSTFNVVDLNTNGALVKTNASGDFSNTTLTINEAVANQIGLTTGTTTLTVEADSLVDQDLTADATPTFDNIIQTVHTDDVSNPPTDAELDAIFGTPATVGAGFTAYIDDNGAGTNFYQIVSDGTNWWIFTGTVAA